MAKFRVKLGLDERDVPNKVELGRTVHLNMTGNANFATPNPTLPVLKTATDDLELAFNNSKHGVLSTALLHEAEEAFDTILTAMGNYVDSIAQGLQAIINSAGMDAAETSHIPIAMVIVTGVEGVSGKLTGEISFKWNKVKGARVYLGWLKELGAPDSDYELKVIVTRRKTVISGLTPGVKYVLILKAVGASGVGPVSDPASAYAAY
jgi:hypothetical protein